MPRLDLYADLRPIVSIRLPDHPILLGRGPDCEVQLPGAQVSRHHFRVRVLGPVHVGEDISRNGTRINASWLRGIRALAPGDRIQIGDHLLVYQLDDAHFALPPRRTT